LWNKVLPGLRKTARLVRGDMREHLVYRAKTAYSELLVVDKNGRRYLLFADPQEPRRRQEPELVYQSFIDLDNPLETRATYADYFHLAWIFNPSLARVLLIGLGGGTVVQRFLHDYPEITVESVEIDPAVVEVAYKYFFLPRNYRHRVIVSDGREYLEQDGAQYDLVLLDAFFSRTIPHRLFTVEFFRAARRRLAPQGILGININGAVTGTRSGLFRSVFRTLSTVYPVIYLFTGKKDSTAEWQNLILFALQEPLRLSRAAIMDRAAALAESKVTIPGYTAQAGHLCQTAVDPAGAAVLTDRTVPPGGVLELF
jgi:spermidine synthase